MNHAISAKTAALAAALVLAGGTVVGAVTVSDDDPKLDEPTRVEPDGEATQDAPERHDANDDGESTKDADAPESEAGGPEDNHGAAVSTVAQDDSLEGREHGEAVSEVARSEAGKPEAAADAEDEALEGAEHGRAGEQGQAGEHGGGNDDEEPGED